MRYQLELFYTALGFFTRVPVPAWVPFSQERLNHAARYFSAVGWVVGFVGALVLYVSSLVLPLSVAVVLSMAATVRLTGCFHEDGFADSCDGLGGGWEKTQVLAIMKDSRIGSYGTVGVVLLLLAKYAALVEMGRQFAPLALVVAHPLSRLGSTALIRALEYVRDDDTARAKPLAVRLSNGELACAATFGLAPLLLLQWQEGVAAALAAALVAALAGRYFVRRIGGYTGDCLGATQQGAELAIYLAFHLAWNFY